MASARILVTGGSGSIGTALARALGDRPGQLRLLAREPWSPTVDAEVRTGDVRDPRVVAHALDGVDVVVHLAGQTSRRTADGDPAADWQANVAPLLAMLEAGRRAGKARTVILAGSETQAGLPERLPLDERAPDRPLTVYDLHKLAAEQVLELYVRRGLAHGTCLRLPTVYGAGPPSRGADRGAVAAMIRQALAGQPLTVYGTGTWRRDLLHLADVGAAVLAALDHPEAVDGRHFVLGTGEGVPVAGAAHAIARAVARHTGRPEVAVRHADPPAGWSAIDERDVIVDATAFRAATGWRPSHDLASGLSETVAALAAEAAAPC